jgi:eukaryotic-like serine/threonine-protein kinase
MSDMLGTRISHYRVVDLLSAGGMGDVYVGYDEKLNRRVVLKSIRSEHRLIAEAKTRFLREARILSKLAHPNICQIFDYIEGDSADFLVLEMIPGRSLAEALKDRMELKEKLRIAGQIADVLVATHEKGIIHRDLKPDNIMLTDGGREVKVLDFGLSRSLQDEMTTKLIAKTSGTYRSVRPSSPESEKGDSDGKLTEVGMVMGTIQYMSPEQARGENATTAGDLYSFGLILQELFSGRPAYDRALPFRELLIKATAGETLAVEGIDADLAVLINRLKSVAPAARPTAVDAAERLNWIRQKPLRRRKKTLFGAAVAILLLFAAAMTLQTLRAGRAEREAQRESTIAKQVSGFLVGLFNVSDPGEARGNSITAREILDRGAERIETELKDQPLVQARMMDTMGNVYLNLGLFKKAEFLFERSLKLREANLGPDDLDVAAALNNLALLYKNQGRYDLAEPLYRRALAMRERSFGPDHADVATSLNNLASLFQYQGDYASAESLYRRALRIRENVFGPDHPDVAELLNNLALLHLIRAEYAQAEPLFKRALAIWEKSRAPGHPDLAIALNNLASLYYQQKKYAEATPIFERSLAIKEKTLGPDHPDLAATLNNLAMLYRVQGRYAQAEPLLDRALAIREKALGPEHPEGAKIMYNMARLYIAQKRLPEAETLFRRALDIYDRAPKVNPERIIETLNEYAQLLRRTQRPAEAEKLLVRAQAIAKQQKQALEKK